MEIEDYKVPEVELPESIQSTDKVVDTSTMEFYPAVKDAKEAHEVCRRLIEDNRYRNERNAKIARRYNDDQPYSQSELNAAGQSWRSNFSSGFLSTLIKRALPSYKRVVDEARTLTLSELDQQGAENREREEAYRINITRTIRRWYGWNDLITQIGLENLLYGYAAVIRPDEIDWRPVFARQDEIFFPEATSQLSNQTSYFCYKQKYQVWELAEYLKNPEASTAAGWNLPNIVKSLNASKKDNRLAGLTEDARAYEDVIRENTLGSTATDQAGIRTADVYHLFVRETSGKITHWIVSEEGGDELFVRFNKFEEMSECLGLFSIEVGDGNLHGSKGAGRLLYNRALAIERARNIATDNYFLAHLVILRATNEGKRHMTMDVVHPFMVLGEGVEVVSQTFQVNEAAFRNMDAFNVTLAEQQIGSYTSGANLLTNKGNETASKVNYVASIEQQIREGVLLRWWVQIQAMIHMIEKSICSPANIIKAYEIYRAMSSSSVVKFTRKLFEFASKIRETLLPEGQAPVITDNNEGYDDEAIDCLIRMFEAGLTPEQIYELAQCPPQQTVEDLTARNAQLIDILASKYMNDPLADKLAIRQADVASKLGYSAANSWFPDKIDQTVLIEEARQQIEEFYIMLQGEDIPVSPRDNDKAHLMVLLEKAQLFITGLQQAPSIDPGMLMIVDTVLRHAENHVQSALQKGMKEVDLAQEIKLIKNARALLKSIGIGVEGQGPGAPAGNTGGSQGMTPPVQSAPQQGPSSTLPNMTMDPVVAASEKPLSQSPQNLTPQV